MSPNHPLRTLAASKLFLLGCIVMSISVLTATVYSFLIIRPELNDLLNEILHDAVSGSPAELERMQQSIEMIVPFSLAFGIILSLALSSVPAVSLWLIYASARSARPAMKTTGFSILRVYLLISICYLVIGLLSAVGEEFSLLSASFLEALMHVAMLVSARKLLAIAADVAKTGKTELKISNQCSILILINLCVSIGTLVLQVIANVHPHPFGQMREYILNDVPTLIAALAVTVVGIAEYAVFFVLSRRGVFAVTADPFPPDNY